MMEPAMSPPDTSVDARRPPAGRLARRLRLGLLPLMILGAVAAPEARAQHGLAADRRAGGGSAFEMLVVRALPIATLQLENGSRLEFLDLRDGSVGVAERTRGRGPLVSIALARKWNATPLEMFMALAPRDQTIPDALRADHDARWRSGAAVFPARLLAGPRGTLDLDDPGQEEFNCDHFGSNFYWGWLDTFEGVTDHAAAAFRHTFSHVQYDFYPGGYYNSDGSITPGYNSITYLGACNGDDDTPFTLEVHRKIGVWVEIAEVVLSDDEKYTFYSNLPASYRGRLKTPGPEEPIEHLGFAVAYTKAPYEAGQ